MAHGRGNRSEASKFGYAAAHASQDFEAPLRFPKDSPAPLKFAWGPASPDGRQEAVVGTRLCRGVRGPRVRPRGGRGAREHAQMPAGPPAVAKRARTST